MPGVPHAQQRAARMPATGEVLWDVGERETRHHQQGYERRRKQEQHRHEHDLRRRGVAEAAPVVVVNEPSTAYKRTTIGFTKDSNEETPE